jgi:two-component system cell cycle response regulator
MQITEELRSNIVPAIKDELALSVRPFKILVAGDSLIDRKLLERTFGQGQYEVLFAKCGQEAMELFAEHRPPLVITDWMMPDLAGIELCKRIRRQSQKVYTYIIVLAGLAERDGIVEALGAGADDYVARPLHPNELLARVGVGRKVAGLHRQIEGSSRLLEELAMTDAATGLLNRRAIEVCASRELSAAARHGFPFWVVRADLDNFTYVNNTFGHAVGDEVLKGFAEILRANTRSADICGRIGGDEFLIVLTHADRVGAQLAIERIREKLEAQRFRFRSGEVRVTASFGIAGHSRHEFQHFNRLMTQADAALYSAKQIGRNRVELAATELYPSRVTERHHIGADIARRKMSRPSAATPVSVMLGYVRTPDAHVSSQGS